MKEIGSGAEATIYLQDNQIIKQRKRKGYRIEEIDSYLRKTRTKIESRILQKISVPAPKFIGTNNKDTIHMGYIQGPKIRDIIHNDLSLLSQIGEMVAHMHNEGIIHADLTTSNMILDTKTKQVMLIDFGLSYTSQKEEDKAVDIHLFLEALESKHYSIAKEGFDIFAKAYASNEKTKKVLDRLQIVQGRGRYKNKGQ